LPAYQSASITQIAFLVQRTWFPLGRPTQKYHAFKQPLHHIELGFPLQNLYLNSA